MLLRVAGSLDKGTVTASLLVARLHAQQRRSTLAAALALVSSAIVTCNTHHMNEIINREQAAGRLPDDLDVARLSPAIHAHVNLNGRYHIHPDQPTTPTPDPGTRRPRDLPVASAAMRAAHRSSGAAASRRQDQAL
jgi:hypothetical protein